MVKKTVPKSPKAEPPTTPPQEEAILEENEDDSNSEHDDARFGSQVSGNKLVNLLRSMKLTQNNDCIISSPDSDSDSDDELTKLQKSFRSSFENDDAHFGSEEDTNFDEIEGLPLELYAASAGPLLHNTDDFFEIEQLIWDAELHDDISRIHRALRLIQVLRKKLTEPPLAYYLKFAFMHRKLKSQLFTYLEVQYDGGPDTLRPFTIGGLDFYFHLLVILFLIDQKRYDKAKACASSFISLLGKDNRETTHLLASRLFFYYSYSYELTGDLAEIRSKLFELHGIAVYQRDEIGQETLLNLLLRNYLHCNMYDQANQLKSKAHFGAHSKNQHCRYLFYVGKIEIIRLEYEKAKECLLQATLIAPARAHGFHIQCHKWLVIVCLLLGEIPARKIFKQTGTENALRPYFELTKAVLIGDLEQFQIVRKEFAKSFCEDKTHNVVARLRVTVMRVLLVKISLAYSCISVADVAEKLKLDSVEDAEMLVAKAIRDGAIDATLDKANGWMLSHWVDNDIYSTSQSLKAFNSRIGFCLELHNKAVKAMRLPWKYNEDDDDVKLRALVDKITRHVVEEQGGLGTDDGELF